MVQKILEMKKIVFGGIFLLLTQGAFASAHSLQLPLLWKTNLNMLLETAPTVADINGDDRDEILIAGMEKLFVLNGQGKELWQWKTRKRFCTYPAVLARHGTAALIYVADNSGQFTCLDAKGKVVWQRNLDGPCAWSAAAVDQNPATGPPRVIQADQTGTVWCFNALTGQVQWKTRVAGKPANPALGDLNGDGTAEVVLKTTDGAVTALSFSGTVLWSLRLGGTCPDWGNNSPVIFLGSDGKARVAVASSDGELFLLNGAGNILWSYPTAQPVASTISVADFDGNGLADLFLVTQLGVIFRLDETGHVLWQMDTQGRSLAPGALIDLNNDGNMEYVLCTQRGHFMVFSQKGEMVYDYQFGNRTINVTPAFGRLSGKKNRLEFAITGGESGQVFCFGTPASVQSSHPWPAYRGNPQNTGSWTGFSRSRSLRMVPQNLSWKKLLLGEPVRFSIFNSNQKEPVLKASAVCIQPDGKRQSTAATVLGRKGDLLLPVDFISPGNYQFSWKLETPAGRSLLTGTKSIALEPFANDRALVQRAISQLQNTAKSLSVSHPLTARALQAVAEELAASAKQLEPKQKSVPALTAPDVKKVVEQTASLNQKAQRALRVSAIAREMRQLAKNTSLLVFEGTFWENRNVNLQLPPAAVQSPKISHTVVSGEHQPVPLVLFNVTNRTLYVRIHVCAVDRDLRLSVRHSVPTPTNLGEISWDALPQIEESGVIAIPSLESRELWLDVQIGSNARGVKTIELDLLALNGAGVLEAPRNPHAVAAPQTHVTLQFRVLPFQMAPEGKFRLCTWSPSSGPALPDLLAHGNNVFLLPQPKRAGKLPKENVRWEFSHLDSLLENFRGHDVFFLFSGFPPIPGQLTDSLYRETLRAYLKQLVTHLKEWNIDTRRFALYPIDEPAGHGWEAVRKLVRFGTLVHKIDPNVQIYADGDGKIPMLKEMARCVDVWAPPVDWLGEENPGMRIIRSTHRTLWSYNCAYSFSRPVGANLKNTNLVGEYRAAALFALRHDATGIGFWCYNATRGDLWERTSPEYNLVYPGKDGPVTSRRWEAVREGIEEARVLMALKSFWRKNEHSPEKRQMCSQIQNLFEKKLPALVDPAFRAVKLGLSRRALELAINEQKVFQFRQDMLECVEEITRVEAGARKK